jgi:ATP-dependent exoDNAse (exonuclease V) alpha subunit
MDIIITPEFKRAYQTLEYSDRSIFIQGAAGCGKSTFLKWLARNTAKNIALLSPTGIAALNIGGQTIHSFFGLKPYFQPPNATIKSHKGKLIRSVDILVIDEISMVRADVFDAVCQLLAKYGKSQSKPYGGVQLCLIGDMMQLPPIVNRKDAQLFHQYYDTPYFFGAKNFHEQCFDRITFSQNFRQEEDEGFKKLLGLIRENKAKEALETINKRVSNDYDKHNTITLTGKNQEAETINARALSEINSKAKTYEAIIKGNWKLSSDDRMPAPHELTLKTGAKVMFTRNDYRFHRWVNGTIGTVRSLHDDYVTVEIANGNLVDVEAEKWEAFKYGTDAQGMLEAKVDGSYSQLPLVLAWAITVHKSQGITLDSVHLNLPNAFAAGQTYVAITRVKSLSGLYLAQPLTQRHFFQNQDALKFENT